MDKHEPLYQNSITKVRKENVAYSLNFLVAHNLKYLRHFIALKIIGRYCLLLKEKYITGPLKIMKVSIYFKCHLKFQTFYKQNNIELKKFYVRSYQYVITFIDSSNNFW